MSTPISGYDSWKLANADDERGPDPYEDEEPDEERELAPAPTVELLLAAIAQASAAVEAARVSLGAIEGHAHPDDYDELRADIERARRALAKVHRE